MVDNIKKDYLLSLFRSKNTVFTFKDISLLWGITDMNFIKTKLYRYIKAKKIFSVRKGIYVKDKNYNKFELATKIYTPSYISLETVLAKEGVIFQYHDTIYAISYLSRHIECDNQNYTYNKIKDAALINSLGIEKKRNYYIASKERAFLDRIYLSKNYYFDNLRSIDFEKCYKLLSVYRTKSMKKILDNYYKLSKE